MVVEKRVDRMTGGVGVYRLTENSDNQLKVAYGNVLIGVQTFWKVMRFYFS